MNRLIVVRGAGDLATGCIVRLVRSGFRVIALETERPTAIRRTVSLSEAVYEGFARVEDVEARLAAGSEEALALAGDRLVPILVDSEASTLGRLRPDALVDAIIAKRNLGTRRGMAPVVVALGPGFVAGIDADAVIETNRGHDLGRVIVEGAAAPDTAVPGEIGGAAAERVVRSPARGRFVALSDIGDCVREGRVIAAVEGEERFEIRSALDGVVRGMLRPGIEVTEGFKVADVDPRGRRRNCFTISDKSRSVGGAVLEAILMLGGRTAPIPQS
ncbi:MAG: selenium-dependent molybdenum cofactor biosynthesis protein YqeB [Rectinemataceae bacterium]